MTNTKESGLEDLIVASLVAESGYEQRALIDEAIRAHSRYAAALSEVLGMILNMRGRKLC